MAIKYDYAIHIALISTLFMSLITNFRPPLVYYIIYMFAELMMAIEIQPEFEPGFFELRTNAFTN